MIFFQLFQKHFHMFCSYVRMQTIKYNFISICLFMYVTASWIQFHIFSLTAHMFLHNRTAENICFHVANRPIWTNVPTFLNILYWMTIKQIPGVSGAWYIRSWKRLNCSQSLSLTPVKLQWTLETRTCGTTSGCDFVCDRQNEKSLMCSWPITYESHENFLKEVSIIILVQNKTM
jgi:hypothetical protein